MTKKFYKMTLPERYEHLLQNTNLSEDDLKAWLPGSGLTLETADHMIETRWATACPWGLPRTSL